MRPKLEKEVFEKKVQLEIPKFFKALRDQAEPKLILKQYTTEEELMRDVYVKFEFDLCRVCQKAYVTDPLSV